MRRLQFVLLGSVLLTTFATDASAATIYRETFGRPATGQPGTSTTNILGNVFDWPMYRPFGGSNNALIQTAADNAGTGGVSSSTANGKPTDVANINAGTNEDGTSGAYPRGIYFMSNTIDGANPGSPKFAWTPEFSFNPADYNNLTFSWYEGNSGTASQFQLAILIGGQWYASAATFANTVTSPSITNFNANAQLMTVNYSPAAANWLSLAFDGTYDVSTHLGTNSSVPLTVGAAPGGDLSGTITGFGLLVMTGPAETRRFDTFQIDGDSVVPEPSSATLAFLSVAGLAGVIRRRK
jgi:hypothetical protein